MPAVVNYSARVEHDQGSILMPCFPCLCMKTITTGVVAVGAVNVTPGAVMLVPVSLQWLLLLIAALAWCNGLPPGFTDCVMLVHVRVVLLTGP